MYENWERARQSDIALLTGSFLQGYLPHAAMIREDVHTARQETAI
jgi:hypothetical protein